MPPILQSITEMYKNQGFDSQASFFEANLPVNVDIPSFDEYKNQLSKINLNSEIDTGTTEITEETEKLLEEKPVDIIGKKEDLEYAKFAKNVYKEKDQRDNINGFKYIEQDSDDLLGTYYNEDTNQLIQSIRGSGKAGDLKNDLGITLGSLGGQVLLSGQFKKLNEQIKKNKEKYSPQKLTVTGHSMGGSLSNYIGVANPDYETVTFNMGQGVPFITDIISCGLAGCKNIKNYRIAGDFASSLSHMFSQGSVFQLKPVIPTESIQLEAESKESIFIPSDFYIPHSIDQFIYRDDNLHPDPSLYGRKLARRVGGVTLAVGLPVIKTRLSSILEGRVQRIVDDELSNIGGEYLNINTYIEGLEEQTGVDTPVTFYNMFNTQYESDIRNRINMRNNLKPIQNTLNFIQGGSMGMESLIGYGVGDVSGVMIYENLLKNSEEQYEKF